MTREEALSYATDTESFLSGEVLGRAPELIQRHFAGKQVLPVADRNTFDAAGRTLIEVLTGAGIEVDSPHLWETRDPIEPDTALVPALRERIDPVRHAVVAVGSGAINDIVKVAAAEAGVRYLVVATAASVDGYTSPGASMVIDGFKQSIYCRAPIGVLADTHVLASAPAPMLSAGYADLASKITAGFDWIIADAVGADPIDPVCWTMIQEDLLDWLADPDAAGRGDAKALERVMYGLTLTGIGMQYLRKSRPASGAEHLMSHIWEMNHHRHRGKPVSHGFQVGVATLAITAFTETLFRLRPDRSTIDRALSGLREWSTVEAAVRSNFERFGSVDSIVAEAMAKHLSRGELEARLEGVVREWDSLADRVASRLVPYATLREWFSAAGCPISSAEISLSRRALVETFALSGMIRNRYTVVDLARELGLLETVSTELLDSKRYDL
jgi:glycerol-1-phosphate dehydrogenase [NAD(P)+]